MTPPPTDAELDEMRQWLKLWHEEGVTILDFINAAPAKMTRLLDEVQRLRGSHEWKPIDTAPKSSLPPVLVWDPYFLMRVARDDNEHELEPTHWMPLPDVPGDAGAG